MTFQVKAEILLNNANWEKNLKKSAKQMEGFGKSMKTIAGGVKAAWAGVAVLGINQLFDGMVDLAKAAAEDNRSMALLNEQIRRTWHGNEDLTKSIDKQIDAMSNATGIADDKLRPALIRIAAVTKNPRKGMKMLSLATDIAAKSGQDLSLVSRNMAKFLGGNKTALDKLVPGLSKAGDRMKFLQKNYAGFAEISGANDPFARINIVIENFQEKLGTALLPLANDFADWMAGPDAQAAMDQVVKWASDTFGFLTSPEGKAAMKEWYDKLVKLVKAVKDIVDKLFGVADFVDKNQATQGIVPAIEKLAPNEKTRGNALLNASIWGGSNMTTGFGGQGLLASFLNPEVAKLGVMTPGQRQQNVTINVTATSANGNDVVKALKSTAAARGVPLGQLLK